MPNTSGSDVSAVVNAANVSEAEIKKDADSKPSSVGEEAEVIKPQCPDRKTVIQEINESDNLMAAMESVAAMYGIPSTNIVGDPTASNINVVRDNIVVPTNTNAKPSDNGKAIIQAIGAVMDYISQRADDKLNQFQADNIRNGINKEKIEDAINPQMGNVFSTHIDANGDPMIVYDNGNVDMSPTSEAHALFDELKAGGNIPMYREKDEGYSYFSKDEDDIMNGINEESIPANEPELSESDATNSGTNLDNAVSVTDSTAGADTVTDVASEIKESSYLIDALSEYNNTRHLGYDIMQEQGFTFVKPCEFFTESAEREKNTQAVSSGIEHMKFDNTNLIKAIELMNEARNEQAGVGRGRINVETLINTKQWQKAIDCLNKQFNARLNIRFITSKGGRNREFTSIYNDIKTHLTVSKSKGFQLGGLPIDIFILNTALDEDAPDDITLFGQHVISVLCHEIFHNIMAVIKSKEAQFTASLAETMTLAKDIPSASNRRKLITNFVNAIDDFGGMKLNVISKRAIVKHLTYLSTIAHDEQALREYEVAIRNKKNETIDEQIKRYEKKVQKLKSKTYGPGRYAAIVCLSFMSLVIAATGTMSAWFAPFLFGTSLILLLINASKQAVEIKTIEKFKSGTIKNYEEHWCDMFAACYNLPLTFFIVGKPRNGVSDDYTVEELKRLDAVEREAMQLMMCRYPTVSERNQSAIKYAKKTLDSKVKLDPPIERYLQWIVSNYSKSLEMDIDETYSKATFDPKTAEDLDKHIENLISKGRIDVTEFDISWLDDLVDDTEYYY